MMGMRILANSKSVGRGARVEYPYRIAWSHGMDETSAAPGSTWFVFAGLVAVATIAAVVALVAWFVLNIDKGVQFVGPGRYTAEFDKPGTYVVWNDYRTVFGGRSYDESEKLPSGVVVEVRNASSGETLK